MFEPTYLLHSRIAWITNTEVAQRRLDPPFTIDDAAIAWAAQTAPDVVFVCSPNNPTGNAQTLDTIRTLADAVDALVIVDEAYIDFGGETALPLTTDHPNLVVLRTLSKAFALAGARLGYCLAAPQVIEDLQRIRLPYHLGALTQAAGIAALRHTAAAEAIVDAMREQRDRLLKELGAIEGLAVHPSEANFVLFVPRAPAADVWQGLLDRGVLIRDLSAVVPNALRVSAGTEHEITRFLDALQEVLA